MNIELIKFKDLTPIQKTQQISVYYHRCYCGKFKKGVTPTKETVENLIIDNGFYECEVRAYFDYYVELGVIEL